MKLQELFKNRESWMQGSMARDKDGKRVGAKSSEAVCWCLVAGIERCYEETYPVLKKISRHLDLPCPIWDHTMRWNDTHTWEDIEKLITELDL